MLPNFKKPDSELPKPVTSLGQIPSAPIVTARPVAIQQPVQSRAVERLTASVIGADLLITGNLISKGEVQIEGEVQGDIHGVNVVVGERAHVTGSVIAEEVVVRGRVSGSVRGRRVMLQASSHVEGDIHHQSLAIEQGAYFEGKSRRVDDAMAGAAKAEWTGSAA